MNKLSNAIQKLAEYYGTPQTRKELGIDYESKPMQQTEMPEKPKRDFPHSIPMPLSNELSDEDIVEDVDDYESLEKAFDEYLSK